MNEKRNNIMGIGAMPFPGSLKLGKPRWLSYKENVRIFRIKEGVKA
ncbi:MAG: hypothetical protein NTX36_12465 [Proteobacteria bacterium]|nr:hypothetical protein [Pseudomonadota bacterium]